jgi:hypothetical protein
LFFAITMNLTLTWTGSLSDDKLGTINASFTLTGGQTKTLTGSTKLGGSVPKSQPRPAPSATGRPRATPRP